MSSNAALRLVAFGILLVAAHGAAAATIIVNVGGDDGAGCTLREAVASANTNTAVGGCPSGDPGRDRIIARTLVELTQSDIDITEDLDFGDILFVEAAPDHRVFRVRPDADVRFKEVDIVGGRAGYGGAIYVDGGASVTLRGGVVRGGHATVSGGAIFVAPGGTLTVPTFTQFDHNSAAGNGPNEGGGAIYARGATVRLLSAVFLDNEARRGAGGAVFALDASVEVGSVRFSSNRSLREGGAVALTGGSLEASGATLDGNRAGAVGGFGGALYVTGTASVLLRETAVTDNAAVSGGGLWLGGGVEAVVDGGAFSGNRALGGQRDPGGGAIYSDGADLLVKGGATFTRNRALLDDGTGGALFLDGGTTRLRDGVSFVLNRAAEGGGAVDVRGGVADLEGASFERNLVEDGVQNGALAASGVGGALRVSGPADVSVAASEFLQNRAPVRGGAVWASGSGALRLTETALIDNRATTGGGVYHERDGGEPLLVIERSLVAFNGATTTGGGVLARRVAVLVRNSTLYGNVARVGGGLAAVGAAVRFAGATVVRNRAVVAGGGLAVDPDGRPGRRVRLDGSVLAENVARRGADAVGQLRSGGYNVVGSTPDAATFPARPTDQVGVDPRLADALADNGGPTETVALAPGSPALEAGLPGLAVDQRGYVRDGAPDAGAFESGAVPPAAAPPPVAGLEAPPAPGLDVFPNPASGRATVRLAVEATQRVAVSVYDVTGRRALPLFDGVLEGGLEAQIPLEASRLAAGVYVVVAEGEAVRASTRLSVVR